MIRWSSLQLPPFAPGTDMKVPGTRRKPNQTKTDDQVVIPTATNCSRHRYEGAWHKEKTKTDDQVMIPTASIPGKNDYLQHTCLHASNASLPSCNHDLPFNTRGKLHVHEFFRNKIHDSSP